MKYIGVIWVGGGLDKHATQHYNWQQVQAKRRSISIPSDDAKSDGPMRTLST